MTKTILCFCERCHDYLLTTTYEKISDSISNKLPQKNGLRIRTAVLIWAISRCILDLMLSFDARSLLMYKFTPFSTFRCCSVLLFTECYAMFWENSKTDLYKWILRRNLIYKSAKLKRKQLKYTELEELLEENSLNYWKKEENSCK